MRTAIELRCAAGLVLVAMLLSSIAVAQDDYASPPPSTGIWGSVYLASGASSIDDRLLLSSDYRLLLAGTEFTEEDLSAYRQTNNFWSNNGGSRAVVLGIGIHPFMNNERKGPELRMGVSYTSVRAGGIGYERSDRYPLDTLVSSSTGIVFFVDSIHTSRYDMGHNAERFGLEGSLIFLTSGRSRWSLQGGVGLAFGARANARTWVNKVEEGVVNYPGTSWRNDLIASRNEEVENSGGMWVAFQVPIGVAFRLSRRSNLLGRMDLYIEGRPGMLVQGTRELGIITSVGSQSLFGLRVRLD
ncbi:MAG: hypothetical protein WEC15_06325 [Flavobacteriales bacterium]